MTASATYLQSSETKVAREINESISYAFQQLIDKPAKTAKAVANKSDLTVGLTGATAKSNLLHRIARVVFPKHVPYLEKDMIINNEYFQKYKQIISKQGFNVDINYCEEGFAKGGNFLKAIGLLGAFGIAAGDYISSSGLQAASFIIGGTCGTLGILPLPSTGQKPYISIRITPK